jgi:hypothetical protein
MSDYAMEESRRRTLVNLNSLKHPDRSNTGPYNQIWADVPSDWHIVPRAEFDVELDAAQDARIRVLTVDRAPPKGKGLVNVVPVITAEWLPAQTPDLAPVDPPATPPSRGGPTPIAQTASSLYLDAAGAGFDQGFYLGRSGRR